MVISGCLFRVCVCGCVYVCVGVLVLVCVGGRGVGGGRRGAAGRRAGGAGPHVWAFGGRGGRVGRADAGDCRERGGPSAGFGRAGRGGGYVPNRIQRNVFFGIFAESTAQLKSEPIQKRSNQKPLTTASYIHRGGVADKSTFK